jgi:hypothetical protein
MPLLRSRIRARVLTRSFGVTTEPAKAELLTRDHAFSLSELAQQSGASEAELRELVAYGAVTPNNPDALQWVFNGKYLPTIYAARRLGVSFALDPKGVALVVSLLDRIVEQDAQLGSLRAKLPRHAA